MFSTRNYQTRNYQTRNYSTRNYYEKWKNRHFWNVLFCSDYFYTSIRERMEKSAALVLMKIVMIKNHGEHYRPFQYRKEHR